MHWYLLIFWSASGGLFFFELFIFVFKVIASKYSLAALSTFDAGHLYSSAVSPRLARDTAVALSLLPHMHISRRLLLIIISLVILLSTAFYFWPLKPTPSVSVSATQTASGTLQYPTEEELLVRDPKYYVRKMSPLLFDVERAIADHQVVELTGLLATLTLDLQKYRDLVPATVVKEQVDFLLRQIDAIKEAMKLGKWDDASDAFTKLRLLERLS